MASPDVTDRFRGLPLSQFEDAIRDLDHEVAAIVDPVRGVLVAREGRRHEVEWTDDDCELMPSRILSHNHPGGDSFSPEDVQLAWEFGAHSVRAVTPAGPTYVLEAPEQGWGAYEWDEIAGLGETWASSIWAAIDSGELSTSTPLHLIWEEVARRLDLTYSAE